MTDLTGHKLGKYVLEQQLGAGGMAAVYRSHHPQFDRPVAIKILPATVQQDPMFRARFEREGRTIAALNHPNIIRVYDIDEADGQFYMVMDLVPGGTLESHIRRGQLDRRWSVETIIKVAEALEFAHGRGVIHRDLKPSNILLDADDQPILADFGIARLLDGGDAQLTSTGTVVGTLAYMAPEQLNGQPSDARADIYSLGVVLYQLLVGRVPFTGDTMTVITGHLTKAPQPPHELAPDTPRAIEDAVLQALAKDPDHRFRSARAFAQALRNSLAAIEPGMVRVASAAPPTLAPTHVDLSPQDAPTLIEPFAPPQPPLPPAPFGAPPQGPEPLPAVMRRYMRPAVIVLVVLVVLGPIARMRVGDLLGLLIVAAAAWFGYSYWRSRQAARPAMAPSAAQSSAAAAQGTTARLLDDPATLRQASPEPATELAPLPGAATADVLAATLVAPVVGRTEPLADDAAEPPAESPAAESVAPPAAPAAPDDPPTADDDEPGR